MSLPVFFMCVSAFLLIRIFTSLTHALTRIDEVFDYNMDRIGSDDFWTGHARYDQSDNWVVNIIDIRKWTYKQFFPKRAGEK